MKRLAVACILFSSLCVASLSWAQAATAPERADARLVEPGIDQWLLRLHAGASRRAYAGTFVVSTGNTLSSSRIWHVCDGQQQMERVEALTGAPRFTFRRNDQVVTFWPERRLAIRETREALGLFPNWLNPSNSPMARWYRLKSVGRERVAGLEADVVQLIPVDALRFGYRVWTEKQTGLVIKLQTLDGSGAVLEQAAFSELQLDAPLTMAKLSALMDNMQGYRVETMQLVKTTAEQEGWVFKNSVPGFRTISCHRRSEAQATAGKRATLQCVFSDGLASVSLFVEWFDAARHGHLPQQNKFATGATHMVMRQLGDRWLTAVGEVPSQTLAVLVGGLERSR